MFPTGTGTWHFVTSFPVTYAMATVKKKKTGNLERGNRKEEVGIGSLTPHSAHSGPVFAALAASLLPCDMHKHLICTATCFFPRQQKLYSDSLGLEAGVRSLCVGLL